MTRQAGEVHGLVLVDKPPGMTSHDVVLAVRRRFKPSRVGHTGTLDPMATGLLILCLGRATKLSRFLTALDKEYEGVIRLGSSTTTYDREGEVVTRAPEEKLRQLDPAAISSEAARFVGEIEQAPPAYSAKKVGGKRFYELARSGEAIPDASKLVRIDSFEIGELEQSADGPGLRFRMRCASGTYVRSVAHDLGERLGVGGHLAELRRTRVGAFTLANAIALEELAPRRAAASTASAAEPSVPAPLAEPWWLELAQIPLPFPQVVADRSQIGKLAQGQKIIVRREETTGQAGDFFRILNDRAELVALGELLHHLGADSKIHVIQPKLVL